MKMNVFEINGWNREFDLKVCACSWELSMASLSKANLKEFITCLKTALKPVCPVMSLRLIYRDSKGQTARQLEDSRTLSDYNIRAGVGGAHKKNSKEMIFLVYQLR